MILQLPNLAKNLQMSSTYMIIQFTIQKNPMINGHCFVSLTMSVPVMETRKGYQQQIRYVPISIGYAMWTPEKSKLELTALSRPISLAIALYMHM